MEIYGSFGPACGKSDILFEMIKSGMTGIRLNLSHTSLKEGEIWFQELKKAEERAGKKIRLLLDLVGGEIRTENKKTLCFQEGQVLSFDQVGLPEKSKRYIEEGKMLFLDDGKILLESQKDNLFQVVRKGRLGPRKTVAFQGKDIILEDLSDGDKESIKLAKKMGIHEFMLPFTQSKEDVLLLRKYLWPSAKIFAKMENKKALENIDAILPLVDVLVIARGDLGANLPLWRLPRIQKEVARKCKEQGKDFMVVTELLHTMIENPQPTRAELSDIYNAFLDGASYLMLTGETAIGKYPVLAIDYLKRTAEEASEDECF